MIDKNRGPTLRAQVACGSWSHLCQSRIRLPSVESVAHEPPPEPPERGPGLWKRSDGRDESGEDGHDANEIDNNADGQNRKSSTC